jgi:hypothetical protein
VTAACASWTFYCLRHARDTDLPTTRLQQFTYLKYRNINLQERFSHKFWLRKLLIMIKSYFKLLPPHKNRNRCQMSSLCPSRGRLSGINSKRAGTLAFPSKFLLNMRLGTPCCQTYFPFLLFSKSSLYVLRLPHTVFTFAMNKTLEEIKQNYLTKFLKSLCCNVWNAPVMCVGKHTVIAMNME